MLIKLILKRYLHRWKFLTVVFAGMLLSSTTMSGSIMYFDYLRDIALDFELSKTINNALRSISNEIKNYKDEKATILFSPASASFDQFKNFEERGNKFKKLVKLYANKYF